jgi:hypothetical protein
MNRVEVHGQWHGKFYVNPAMAVESIIGSVCGIYDNPWVEEKDGKFYVMVLDQLDSPVVRSEITADEYYTVEHLTKALKHLNNLRDAEIENERAYEQFKSKSASKKR